MLYTKTVTPGTLSLLKRLMELPALQPYSLVGGTAMSLRYGHRSSVDLDLFYHLKSDHSVIEAELRAEFGDAFVYEHGHRQLGIFCYIRKIKVDIV